jgi:hypothetical protein
MIENMQNSIRQQGGVGGLDPFGSTQSQNMSFDQLLQSIPQATSSTASSTTSSQNGSVQSSAKLQSPRKCVLEERFFVSADKNLMTVESITNKLLSLADETNDTKKIDLSEEDKKVISACKAIIAIVSSDDLPSLVKETTTYPREIYPLIHRLLCTYPQAHMSSLFMLRLIFLSPFIDDAAIPLIDELLQRLATGTSAFSGKSDEQ